MFVHVQLVVTFQCIDALCLNIKSTNVDSQYTYSQNVFKFKFSFCWFNCIYVV